MSDPSDRPPRRGSGASGTPGSIGKALGGDLDFEPDALLDSLTESEEARPTTRPPAAEAPAPADEPLDAPMSYADDEVTLVGPREFFEATAPRKVPALPSGITPAPSDAPRPTAGTLGPPPAIPRPTTPGTAAPLRPAVSAPPRPTGALSRTLPGPAAGPMSTPPRRGASSSPLPPTDAEPPDAETRTSLTPEEIAALDELESLRPEPITSAPPARSSFPPPSGSNAPWLVMPSSRPPSFSASNRPAGSAELPRPGQANEWRVRAEWLEGEARRIVDPHARSRALVVASELWAIAGDVTRARRAAQDAHSAGRAAVAGRQLRSLAAAGGDWKTVASMLEIELRSSSTDAARAHATLLDANVHRLCLGDEAAGRKKIDLVIRSQPDDPRGHLEQIIEALAGSTTPPELHLPESSGLDDLSRTLEQVMRLRTASGDPKGQGALAAFGIARRALGRGDRAAAAAGLVEIGSVEGLGDAADWLSAALLAHDAESRNSAAERLRGLLQGPDSAHARRALAARALELGDASTLAAALEPEDEVFSNEDRLAFALLSGADAPTIEALVGKLGDEELAPLCAAALSSAGRPTPGSGSEAGRAEAALGRALAGVASRDGVVGIAVPLERFAHTHDEHPVGRLLGLELALAIRATPVIAEALGSFPGRVANAEPVRDRALVRGLLLELADDTTAARAAYGAASAADPGFEAALRARLPGLDDAEASRALAELADTSADPVHAALTLVEAALKNGADDAGESDDWLRRATTLDPTLGLAFRVGEELAERAGDGELRLDWLRLRREGCTDDVERSLDLVREALTVADSDGAAAAELLETAVAAHPGDVGLRERLERLRPGDSATRGAWREASAEHASEGARVLLLLQAAFEYERAQDRGAAARTARRASELGGGALAALMARRMAPGTPEAARVSEELLARAKAADDPLTQRELYQELGEFDRRQGDTAGTLLWQSAILERSPESLPALRQLEHAYTSAAREEELEPIAATLARILADGEGVAHARIAARVRLKGGAWAARRELAELALERDRESLWALRALAAHARAGDEPERALELYRRLEELVVHPLDKAALSLRAAEAAARLGRLEEARKLLEACLESAPEHLVVLTTLGEVLEGLRDFGAAATTIEALAEASAVDAHRVTAWHQAATLWLDKVGDLERGRAALERTVSLDPTHEDAIVRLQSLLMEQGDHPALAALLERRIDLASDGEERIALEVQRGRLLAGVGETAAARSALAAALDANPDHAGALEALAELSRAEGDWTGAEQAWIRLVRHVPEPERQSQIYRKLAELYDVNLPNPERAELAHLEVLKRAPDDTATVERLVQLFAQRGQAERAVELQTALLERAATPEQKRDRTLGLGLVLEQLAKDGKRADATFERARREWPQDMTVLRTVVEYHRRAGESRAAQMLIDRAANDARRALATGRFEPSLFEILGTTFDLRGAADAALVADATLAALNGQPYPVRGAGIAAADPNLDELLSPELVTSALRTLLKRAGDVLDAAYALDLRTLRAAPLPADNSGRTEQIRDLAKAFGIQGIELLVSPVLGSTCLAARSMPAQLVYGLPLLERGDDATRYFLLIRALKLVQARAAALARTVPIELGPIVAGFLSVVANYEPEGIDPRRLAEAKKRIKDAMIHPFDAEASMLALEVVGSVGSRASQLANSLSTWANRVALLAVGNPLTALRAIALVSGAELPDDATERLRFIARNAEARDMVIFSVSEQYAEARKRLGIQG